MTFVLVVLVLLALVFGVGAVLEGIAWALLVSVVIVVAAVWLGWRRLRGVTRGRPQ